MNRTLSSSWTFFYKYLFPVIWIVGFAMGARMATDTRRGALHVEMANGAAPDVVWFFLLVGLVGVAAIFWTTSPLKRVRVGDDDTLIVSNYMQEWRVPFGLITSVTQNKWLKMRPITVRLRADVGCGTRVVFMPPLRLRFIFWHEDPEVAELRELAGIREAD